MINLKPRKFLFFRKDLDGEKSFSTTNATKSIPSKVYGIVSNGLLEKFKEYDAFYFSAERRHSTSVSEYDTKIKIYGAIANKISKRIGAYFYESEMSSHCQFLVSNQKLSDEDQQFSKLKNPLEEAMKECGLI